MFIDEYYLILPTCQDKETKRSVIYFNILNTFVLLTTYVSNTQKKNVFLSPLFALTFFFKKKAVTVAFLFSSSNSHGSFCILMANGELSLSLLMFAFHPALLFFFFFFFVFFSLSLPMLASDCMAIRCD